MCKAPSLQQQYEASTQPLHRSLLWRDAPASDDAMLKARIPDDANVSAELRDGSEIYSLICDHIAKGGTAHSFTLDVGSSKCAGHFKGRCSRTTAREASLALGLGCFRVPWQAEEIHALHQTLGAPVGTGCGVDIFKTLVLYATSADLIKNFVDDVLEKADRTKANTFTVYRWHCKYSYWQRDQQATARPIESVVLPRETKQRIVTDLEEFEEEETQAWYESHGIPYKRSYLFYGVPGSGKTSLIQALAGKHRRNVCYLSPTHPEMTDDSIKSAVQKAPSRSILILEDVDALFSKERKKKIEQSPLTFSGLLNALDGVGGSEGQVFILTTNLRDELDPALIRNGRVDLHVHFGHAEVEQMRGLYREFYPAATAEQAAAFEAALVTSLGDEKVSMAALQHFFILQRKASADKAIANVKLVVEEVERRKNDEAAKEEKKLEDKATKGGDEGAKRDSEGKEEGEDEEEEASASGVNVHVHLHSASKAKGKKKA
uniref:AAA+ ATPase domain-containing protein n=1 Tax=Haptolina brevifila TaxID=156173 RepID=A0A7S2DIS1_9EUKA|mmetsp:Transcript_39393/g.78759  ORF Transcript_39393/g.78759 Transcript_39393/m.78759 type:complete len:490 (+) Transcript_39393:47-1516(+)|eukprot:CAMPEP_0174695046 /NCGR_PEP_ID=MMETSP1094-20130205/1500_1 /TAXON_ID=156173 /ORGANISM="Chrysochromulina brevifilum, Strain UTEX LB 985" /LENGTH=489 /DNA_ID=CAMNT_0015891443 /DNA_START=42 /DNA_END=1511 /DNA_ORIENTATION=-